MHKSFATLHGPLPAPVVEDSLLDDAWRTLHPEQPNPTMEVKQLAKAALRVATEARQQQFEDFHAHMSCAMDARFRGARAALRSALARQDANLFWALFWHNVEGSISDFTAHTHDCNASRHMGRGSICVKSVLQQPLFADHMGGNCEKPLPSWLIELTSNKNRSKHLANCLCTLHKGRTHETKLPRLLRDIGTATTNMRKFLQAVIGDPGVLTEGFWLQPPPA